jgi:hypothetical protein
MIEGRFLHILFSREHTIFTDIFHGHLMVVLNLHALLLVLQIIAWVYNISSTLLSTVLLYEQVPIGS